MSEAQPGIFDEDATFHHHLEFAVDPDADLSAMKSKILGLGVDNPEAKVVPVIGLGPGLAEELMPDRVPTGLRSFGELGTKNGFHAPSTQNDL